MKSFNLESSTQIIEFTHKLQNNFYTRINNVTTNSRAGNVGIRFVGFGIGLSSAALTVMGVVGSLGESIIKNFGNIIMSIKKRNMECFFKGLNGVFIGTPLSLLAVIILPFHVIIGTTITTVAFIIHPNKYSAWRAKAHSPSTLPLN